MDFELLATKVEKWASMFPGLITCRVSRVSNKNEFLCGLGVAVCGTHITRIAHAVQLSRFTVQLTRMLFKCPLPTS